MTEDYPGQAYFHEHNANIKRAEESAMTSTPAGKPAKLEALIEVKCPRCNYQFQPRQANLPNAHCPNCRFDFTITVTNSDVSEDWKGQVRNQDYRKDLHYDLQSDAFALEYLAASAKEGMDALQVAMRDLIAARTMPVTKLSTTAPAAAARPEGEGAK